MYLQIVDYCNMECIHCGISCTKEGTAMPQKVFDAALDAALKRDDWITIGGGEPTLHPNFRNYLLDAIEESENVFVITNGSVRKHALLLAKLNKAKIICASLSVDCYHDRQLIDDDVWDSFENNFRDVHKIIWAGRAKENFSEDDCFKHCMCLEIMVKPSGDIYQCGCEDSLKIGNIFDPNINSRFAFLDSLDMYGECSNEIYKKANEKCLKKYGSTIEKMLPVIQEEQVYY